MAFLIEEKRFTSSTSSAQVSAVIGPHVVAFRNCTCPQFGSAEEPASRPLDLLIDCAVPTRRAICFGSALEGNQAPESRIREAVLSGFDVTRKSVFESQVSGNRDDEVVPAMELIKRQLIFKLLLGLKKPRAQLACVGIEY